MENNTPLWLDLKKEYIDDNFEKLLPYLRDTKHTDTFYNTTIELLRERINILVESIANRPLHQDEEIGFDHSFNIRLLAAWLLSGADTDSHKTYLAMLGELRHLVPKYSEEFLKIGMKSLRYEKVKSPGILWDDIIRFSVEIFAYKVINNSDFLVPRLKERWWKGYGSICQTTDLMYLLPSSDEKTKKTLTELAVCISAECGIRVLPAGKEKLKQSLQSDFAALNSFVESFIEEMKKSKPKSSVIKSSPSYSDNDKVVARVIGVQGDIVTLETTDPNYPKLIGPLEFSMRSNVYYYPSMFAKWLKPDYTLPVHIKSITDHTFTLERTFLDFIVADCEKNEFDGKSSLAKLIDTTQREYVWINESGIPIYTERDPKLIKGAFAYIRVTESGTGKYRGKFTGEIDEYAEETFFENESRDLCIQAFCKSAYDGEIKDKNSREEEVIVGLDPSIIKLILRHLFAHQKHLMKPSDRAKLLAITRIMAEMQKDQAAAEYIDFANSYLRALVLFARDEDLSAIKIKMPTNVAESKSALKRMAVVQLLSQWGNTSNEEDLISYANEFKNSEPTLSRIARIIQTSNSMREIVTGASLNMLKREIIKALQLENDEEGDLESENGAYLGVESGSTEFKESVVFPPDNNMQANEERQVRNILKGICAFLNSQVGGTLYIGVSDQGYIKGIQNDLDFLHISADTYMRVHIQDPAKKMLGLDAIAYMKMELLYDEQVVAIHVEPYPYRVVELEGNAYQRINAENRLMTDFMKQQMIAKKVFTKREAAANLSSLQHAIQGCRQVILHRYASSNSNSVTDREVEPYCVYPEANIVTCLDLNDMKCKCFNINRIGYVEILEKEWLYKTKHNVIKVDAFHLSGEKKIHCTLELDLMAKNLLCEEYPLAKESIKKSGKENYWILDIDVYNINGIGRFCMGLAAHITILDAPELKAYIKSTTKDILEHL